jgi:hypothetical protein
MSEHKETDPKGYSKGADKVKAEVLSAILQEHDIFTAQRTKRVELLQKMEAHTDGHGTVGYLAFLCSDFASIDSQDIPAIADALLSLGEVDQLNLIINGPGGDGTVAEKIIQLCRSHCGQFRVLVPNRAKSAATIVALGADEIVMGYCSELGPIDAQVPVVVAGIPRYISAQSFIDSKASLELEFHKAIKAKQDPRAILQQIATLDMPFIDHCGKLMEFSREIARKCLNAYMFRDITPASKREKMVDTVLTGLSSVDTFKVHGRMINGSAAKNDLNLAVKLLGKNEIFWKDIWQYYVRADLVLSRIAGASKLIETKEEILVLTRSNTAK